MAEFIQGKPCKRCGGTERYAAGKRNCVVCSRARSRNWAANNPEKKLEHHRNWAANNPEKMFEKNRNWRANNPDYKRNWLVDNPEYNRNWCANNPEYNRNWSANNPDKRRAHGNTYANNKRAAINLSELMATFRDIATKHGEHANG